LTFPDKLSTVILICYVVRERRRMGRGQSVISEETFGQVPLLSPICTLSSSAASLIDIHLSPITPDEEEETLKISSSAFNPTPLLIISPKQSNSPFYRTCTIFLSGVIFAANQSVSNRNRLKSRFFLNYANWNRAEGQD
jgi:hypothetical protein